MILEPHNPILDLPADSVAQIIIVHERSSAVVQQSASGGRGWMPGKIKRSTALMRVSEIELRRMAEMQVEAMPVYWCPRGDGRIELWPRPDQAYDCEAMAVGGKPVGDSARRPVVVPTVLEFATAMQRSYDEQQKSTVPAQQRVERFAVPVSEE